MTDGKKIRVMLVEDHAILREGVRRLIDAEPDMEVVGEAADGRSGMEAAERKTPDVILMDLSMPGMNGIEATRQITKGGGKSRVICLSMHKEHKMVEAVLQAGASGYLLKNCSSPEMMQAIRSVASGGTFISPAVAGHLVDALVRTGGEPRRSSLAKLTDREREVLQLIAEGLSAKEVASRLGISQKTVLAHRGRMLEKLDLSSDVDLARYALKQGITEL